MEEDEQINTPSENSIRLLNEKPELAPMFDQRYGEGAHQQYLQPTQEDQPQTVEVEVETDDDEGGIIDAVTKTAGGVLNGAIGFVESASDLGNDIGNAVTGTNFETPELPRVETNAAGKLVEGVTQFALGYASGTKALQGLGWAAKVGQANIGRSMVVGGAADFVSFQEDEERLSNLVQEYPLLSNPVTDYLQASPDDNWAEGRFKNVIEGMGLGVATDWLLRRLKGLKTAKALSEAGDEAGATKALQDTNAEIAEMGVEEGAVRSAPQSSLSPEQLDDLSFRLVNNVSDDISSVSEAFNLGRWETPDELNYAVDDIVKQLEVNSPEVFSEVQTLATVKQMAEDLVMKPDELMAAIENRVKDADRIPAELVALKLRSVATTDYASKMAKAAKDARAAGDKDAFNNAVAQIRKAHDIVGADLYNLKVLGKSYARGTSAGRIATEVSEKNSAVTPGQFMQIAKDYKGDQDKFIEKLVETGAKPHVIRRALGMVTDNKAWHVANEFWINSILSGPWTHAVNAVTAAGETLVRPLEGATGAMIRGNSNAFKAELKTYAGIRHAAKDSFAMARKALMEERNVLDPVHAIDETNPYHAIKAGNGKITGNSAAVNTINGLGKVIRMPGRFLAGGDEFFKQINYRSKLYSEGFLDGMDQGLKGSELEMYARKRVEEGFDTVSGGMAVDAKTGEFLHPDAAQYARETTFTEDLEYGLGKSLQELNSKHPALRQILPFVRTPTNLIRHTLRRTPLALVNTLDKNHMDALSGKLGAKAQSEAYARTAIGSALTTTAAFMAADGWIEGKAPSDPSLRRQFFDSGRKEYSFKRPDGTYWAFNRADPRFAIFGIVADITKHHQDLPEEDQSLAALLPTIAMSATNNLASKSYLKGISETMEVLVSDDQDKWERYFRWQIGSRAVPFSSLMRTINPDKEMKELRSVTDGILANVPGFSDTVEPKRNVFGEPMEVGNPFVGSKTSEAVKEELYQLGEGFGLPPKRFEGTKINLENYESPKVQTAYDRLQELTGTIKVGGKTMKERMEETIASEGYQRLPMLNEAATQNLVSTDSARKDILDQIIRGYRNAAKMKLREEYPELDKDLRTALENEARAPYQGSEALKALSQSTR